MIAKSLLLRSLKMALVVGTILNIINQPQACIGAEPFHLLSALLTYTVPFCVATCSAVAALRAGEKEQERA